MDNCAPRATDDRVERRKRRCVWANRCETVGQLITQINQGNTKSVSSTTFQATLLQWRICRKCLVNALMLTTVCQRRRLEFACRNSSWKSTESRQVAFSLNHVLCTIEQVHVPAYRVKHHKINPAKKETEDQQLEKR